MTSIAEQVVDQSAHKRRMNELIHESLSEHVESQPIAFFCECPSEHCFETVWQTAEEYEAVHRHTRASLLAPGH
jgi:redox-regulated HSP33 family molecular chaperone